MGSVRLTKDRANTIHTKAMRAFELANPEPTLSSEIIELIWQGAHNDPVQIATRNFVAQHNDALEKHSITITATQSETAAYHLSIDNKAHSVDFKWSTNRLLYGERRYGYRHELQRALLRGISVEQREQVEEACRQHIEEEKQLRDKKSQFSHQTSTLLDECNTLKQLLESWPAAKEFVDSEDIRQMHEKITRKQAAKRRIDTSGVDIDSLNQVVLTSKLVA